MFKNKSKEYILDFFSSVTFSIKEYYKNEIIKNEGDICTSVGIVLEGVIDIKRMLGSQVVHISSFTTGSLFGEVIAFSDVAYYPATVISNSSSMVMYIKKDDFIHFCMEHEDFLSDFMRSLTNKIIVLNNTITNSTFTSIRQKIANFLITEYKRQKSTTIKLNYTKEKLSEKLGINRPSLSRVLINMKEDGLIDYSRDTITILAMEELENSLC